MECFAAEMTYRRADGYCGGDAWGGLWKECFGYPERGQAASRRQRISRTSFHGQPDAM